MAFMKYAYASVVQPFVSKSQWHNIRVAGQGAKVSSANLAENLVDRASGIFGDVFDPKQYLLTHATIVASVDGYAPKGSKTGSVLVDGFKVNRKFPTYRVTPETDSFLNNNLDGWERPVLLMAYPTFVGGHNWVEHLQVEELSKGRIIDAVARDIGPSVYIDILIATNRKHADLIAAIESGKMATLSMGCSTDGTKCTKCGNWAADETELCNHIKYEKGNTFFDENGVKHRVAELCGDASIGPHGGVQFIEASWVGTPAFTGAVLRNVLTPTEEIVRKAQKILAAPPPQWTDEDLKKVASLETVEPQHPLVVAGIKTPALKSFVVKDASEDFFAGWEDEGGDIPVEEPAAPAKAPSSPLKDVEEDLYKHVMERVKDRLRKDLTEQDPQSAGTSSLNETLVKQAHLAKKAYRAGLDQIVRTAKSDADLIDRVASYNQQIGIAIPVGIYRTALRVGSSNRFKTAADFISACQQALGRSLSPGEAKTLIRLGKLLSQGQSLGKF